VWWDSRLVDMVDPLPRRLHRLTVCAMRRMIHIPTSQGEGFEHERRRAVSVDYIVGDTRDVTATIPDGSVSLVACSPPFIALRSYLPADHPDKDKEIGSEPDPATFLDTLLGLTAEWGRVLAPWGSIAIELGDTFSGSGGGGGDYLEGGMREGQQQFAGSAATMRAHWRAKNQARSEWPLAKSLALVPQLYAASLAYGRNLLTGQPSPAGQWRVRNMIVWHRPNPSVGALGDKFRPCTSYITVATRDRQRWFDLTAVRGEPAEPGTRKVGAALASKGISGGDSGQPDKERQIANPAAAPPLDCWFDEWDGSHDTWTQTTQPSSLAHYAMWPAKLAERLILSMCPAEVCTFCREPRRRIEGAAEYVTGRGKPAIMDLDRSLWPRVDESILGPRGVSKGDSSANRVAPTIGWTDCGCGVPFTPGTVLDPFAGTGTTLAVADLHGRNAIGIDIDARNHALYPPRRAEVARNLFGSPIPDPDQLELFGVA